MATQMFVPRKQRTRQHVIADLSINYVERIILEAGHTVLRVTPDYGYDLVLFTYDEMGFIEPGFAYVQVKAAESLEGSDVDYVFDLDIRDYNLWRFEKMPVILILFAASSRRGYWLWFQNYFSKDAVRQRRKGAKSVRVRVPQRQPVTRKAVAVWRDVKQQALQRTKGEES
jgi:hypothetical protein